MSACAYSYAYAYAYAYARVYALGTSEGAGGLVVRWKGAGNVEIKRL